MIPVDLYQAMAEDCPPARRFLAVVRRGSLITTFWGDAPATARSKAEAYRDSLTKPKTGARKAPARRVSKPAAAEAAAAAPNGGR